MCESAEVPQILQVIDPANRTGKIFVPIENTHDTLGRAELAKNSKKNISLCLLYQQRRCNAGQKCNQIHADRWFIQKLRKTPSKEGTCCPRHGVSASLEGSNIKTVLLKLGSGNNVSVPLDRITKTAIFERSKRGDVVALSINSVCRLHQRNGCKFGRNCTNVHICRQLGGTIPALAAMCGTKDSARASKAAMLQVPPAHDSLDSSTRSLQTAKSFTGSIQSVDESECNMSSSSGFMSRRASAISEWATPDSRRASTTATSEPRSFRSQRRDSTLSTGAGIEITLQSVVPSQQQTVLLQQPINQVPIPAAACPDSSPELPQPLPLSPVPEPATGDVSTLLAGSLQSFRLAWAAPVEDTPDTTPQKRRTAMEPIAAELVEGVTNLLSTLPVVDSDGEEEE